MLAGSRRIRQQCQRSCSFEARFHRKSFTINTIYKALLWKNITLNNIAKHLDINKVSLFVWVSVGHLCPNKLSLCLWIIFVKKFHSCLATLWYSPNKLHYSATIPTRTRWRLGTFEFPVLCKLLQNSLYLRLFIDSLLKISWQLFQWATIPTI